MTSPRQATTDLVQVLDAPERTGLRYTASMLSLSTMLCLPVISYAQAVAAPAATELPPASVEQAAPAAADETPPAQPVPVAAFPETKPGKIASVTITGSRVARAGFTSPTPITTVDATSIAASGVTNIGELLNETPSFRPSITATSSDSRTYAPGASYADLRGLGSIRTLVLVNGERFVPEVPPFSAALTNQVDLNVIPTIAIQRSEIVTGGASAAWGSDALAGVTNLVLYKRFKGVKLDAGTGVSERGDNKSYNAAVLAGTTLLDDRLSVVGAISAVREKGIGDVFTRPWGERATHAIPNAACKDCFVLGDGYQYSAMTAGGYITNTALKGTAFGPGGAPYTFPVGTFVGGAYEFGGSVPGNYPQEGVALKAPNDRVTAYSHIEYDVNEALKVHATFNLADISAKTYSTAFMNTYTIRSGNPYIPAAIQSRMTASNISSFNLAYLYSDLDGGRIQQSVDQVTARASFGFKWDLGNKWEADGHAAYGDNTVKQKYPGLLNTRKAAQAANAVLVNGQIQCADTSGGCVPLNVFGSGSASSEALAFIRSDAWTNVKYVQETAAVNLRGEPFNTWAGPVSFATGLEYRRETQTDKSDALQASGALQGLNQQSFDGSLNVRELYVESVLPLAKDLPLVKSFDVNLGARGTRYSLIGQANTWKAGATWNVTDELLLRATRSRDIRAPNLTELFFPLTRTNSNVQIVGQTQLANFSTGGNSSLKPEVANGTVAGLTYRPKALAGLDLSLDVYKMDIANVISSASSSQILSACAAGYAPSCAQITTVNGIITDVQGGFSNISSLQLKGIDAELSYTRPLTGLGLPGSLQVRALGTYTDKLVYQAFPGVAAENFAGQTSAGLSVRTPFFAPRMKGTFSVGYRDRSLSTSLVANYISKSKVQKSLTTAQYANNDVPSYVTFDLQGSYNFGEKDRYQLYATVKNLADKAPPYTPNVLLFIPTNPAIYDVIGRTFKVGLRYSY